MKVQKGDLDGILIIQPDMHADDRGFFLESFEQMRYLDAGITDKFVQDNHSRSKKNVLRGLHFAQKNPQAQIVTVIRGTIYDVTVDIRKNSPTFGKWFGVELSHFGSSQIYMPPGFAHGFCVLSDWADLHYKVSEYYDPTDDGGIAWNDFEIGINWPIEQPIISTKDRAHPALKNLGLKHDQ
jgi:dTDP-4-dehydrorhamnose 3,5-epimerase